LIKLNGDHGAVSERAMKASVGQKRRWLASIPGLQSIRSVLVMDRVVPLLQEAPHPVIPVFDLDKYLAISRAG